MPGTQMRKMGLTRRFKVSLGVLPVNRCQKIMPNILLKRHIAQVVVIREHRRFRMPARLSSSDGPVGRYLRGFNLDAA